MTSSCLSGGGRPYGFDLDIVKSPARSSSPASSSLTSTLSESSNSPLSICTRKSRTPRKRPNQTYHEAAALLSTAYPNIFSATQLTYPRKPPPRQTSSPDHPSQLFLPFRAPEDESVFPIHHPSQVQKLPSFRREDPGPSPSGCPTPEENEIQSKAAHLYDDYEEDFDTESMLDEETEEGIMDSIMGEKRSGSGGAERSDGESKVVNLGPHWDRSPMALLGLGGRLDICCGIRRGGVSAWRDVGQVNWWKFPTVNVDEISPKLRTNPVSNNRSIAEKTKKKKKKKKKVEKPQTGGGDVGRNRNAGMSRAMWDLDYSRATLGLGVMKKSGMMLKLDYDNVLEAWTQTKAPPPPPPPPTML